MNGKIVLLVVLFGLLIFVETASAQGVLSFAYLRYVNITSSQDLSNYQINITINTTQLIAQGKMRSDCGDIRFYDPQQQIFLPYWIESETKNTNATRIWVNVTSIPAGTKTIWMLYGNSSITSAENASAVFPYFVEDLFNTLNSSFWVHQEGTREISTSYFVSPPSSLRLYYGTGAPWHTDVSTGLPSIASNEMLVTQVYIRNRGDASDPDRGGLNLLTNYGSPNIAILIHINAVEFPLGTVYTGYSNYDVWRHVELRYIPATNTVIAFFERNHFSQTTITFTPNTLGLGIVGYYHEEFFDNFRMFKMRYVASPPSVNVSAEMLCFDIVGSITAVYPDEPHTNYSTTIGVSVTVFPQFTFSVSFLLDNQLIEKRRVTLVGSNNLEFTFTPTQAKNYSVQIVLDADNEMQESNETNNVLNYTLRVVQFNAGNQSISRLLLVSSSTVISGAYFVYSVPSDMRSFVNKTGYGLRIFSFSSGTELSYFVENNSSLWIYFDTIYSNKPILIFYGDANATSKSDFRLFRDLTRVNVTISSSAAITPCNYNTSKIIIVDEENIFNSRNLTNTTIVKIGAFNVNLSTITIPYCFMNPNMNLGNVIKVSYVFNNRLMSRAVNITHPQHNFIKVPTMNAENFAINIEDAMNKYINGYLILEETNGEVLDFNALVGLSGLLSILINKVYVLKICTHARDECRVLGYLQYNPLGYATYIVKYPVFEDLNITYRTPALKYNIYRQDTKIIAEYVTLQGNTHWARFTIWDGNNIIYNSTIEAPQGRFVFQNADPAKVYKVNLVIMNSYENVNTTQILLGQFIPIVRPGQTPPPQFEWTKAIDERAGLIFFGGLCLFVALLFRRELTPIGLAVSLGLVTTFTWLGLLNLNENTIILLAVIVGLSFFNWFRERKVVMGE